MNQSDDCLRHRATPAFELLPSDSCHDFHPFSLLAKENSEAEIFFGLYRTLYLIFSTTKKTGIPEGTFSQIAGHMLAIFTLLAGTQPGRGIKPPSPLGVGGPHEMPKFEMSNPLPELYDLLSDTLFFPRLPCDGFHSLTYWLWYATACLHVPEKCNSDTKAMLSHSHL